MGKKGLGQWSNSSQCAAAVAAAAAPLYGDQACAPSAGGSEPPKDAHGSEDGLERPLGQPAPLTQAQAFQGRPAIIEKNFDGYIGTSQKPLHLTHKLYEKSGVIWCSRCGRSASVKAVGLTKECGPPTKEGRKVLLRLSSGLPPNDKDPFPNPDDEQLYRLIYQGC